MNFWPMSSLFDRIYGSAQAGLVAFIITWLKVANFIISHLHLDSFLL